MCVYIYIEGYIGTIGYTYWDYIGIIEYILGLYRNSFQNGNYCGDLHTKPLVYEEVSQYVPRRSYC